MKIFITGAAGFIGSNTAEILARNNHKILVFDNFSTGKPENLKGIRNCRIFPGDITDRRSLAMAFADFEPESVLHLAAQSAISTALADPQYDMSVNGIGTLNLLQYAKEFKVKRFVFASTSAVYRENRPFIGGMGEDWPCEPSTPYGISKMACEHYIRTMFPNHMILRYGNVYGPKQVAIGENQVVARAFAHFILGDPFQVTGHGNQKRDFVYVEDIAFANQDALLTSVVGTFNIATGKSTSVNTVLSEIEKIYEVPGYKWAHTHRNDPRGSVYISPAKIRRVIGWNARISLAEGLKRTADWWNASQKFNVKEYVRNEVPFIPQATYRGNGHNVS